MQRKEELDNEEMSLSATINTMRDRPSGVHRCGSCGRRGGRNHEGRGCRACVGKSAIVKQIAQTLNSKAEVKIVVDTAFANGVGLDIRDLAAGCASKEIYARIVNPIRNWRTVCFAKEIGARVFDAADISLADLSNSVHANANDEDLLIVIGGIPARHIIGLGRMRVKVKIVVDEKRWNIDGTPENFCDVSEFKRRKLWPQRQHRMNSMLVGQRGRA